MLISDIKIKHNNDIKYVKFYESSAKSTPFFSLLIPVIGHHSIYFQIFEHRILTYSLTAYECKHKYATRTIIYKSDFPVIQLRRIKFFSIINISNLEYPYQSYIQIFIQNLLDDQ